MSGKKRNIILLLCVLLLALLVLLDNILIKPKLQSRPASEEQAKKYDLEKYHAGTFVVIHVIDGDTLDIDIPDGQSEYTRIRLLGIDAPEKIASSEQMYFGREAAEFTKKMTLGKQVEIYLDKANDTRGKYGRLLAYVKIPDGKFLNEVLLSEGFAYADLRFSHSLYNKYKQIESRARSGKKGLWKNVTPIQMPRWLRERERQ